MSELEKVDKSYAYSNRASVMHLWDNENPMNVFEWELGQTLETLNINNDETEIAVATEGGKVTIWNIAENKPTGVVLAHSADVISVAYHAENNGYLYTLINNGTLYGWDLNEQSVFMGPVKLEHISNNPKLFINEIKYIL